ncbi:MAG: hypothetical protein ACXVCP_09525 [Bdellovibrio sp.]
MKKNTLTITLALALFSVFPTLVHAQVLITGTGIAYSQTPPECDENSIIEAKAAADQNAGQQCQGSIIRVGEYALKCRFLAHGLAARAEATATYECKP